MILRRLPWRTLVVAAVILAAAAPAAFGPLHYERGAVLDGQAWRLLTGHLVHGSAYHLRWDLFPLLAVGLLFEPLLGRRFWHALVGGALAVGLGILLLAPDLGAYCGLSGALNALWAAGALAAARAEAAAGNPALAWVYRLALLADLGKIAVEASTGVAFFTDPAALGGTPVPLAHALGAAAGIGVVLLSHGAPRGTWGRRRVARGPAGLVKVRPPWHRDRGYEPWARRATEA